MKNETIVNLTEEDFSALKAMIWECGDEEYAWAAVQLFKSRNGLMSEEEQVLWEKKLAEASVSLEEEE